MNDLCNQEKQKQSSQGFPVNFPIFLRSPNLQNTSRQLFLQSLIEAMPANIHLLKDDKRNN